MKYIRASDRIPPTGNHYHGKVDGIKRIINFYQQNGINYCYVSNHYSIHEKHFDSVWWVDDESMPEHLEEIITKEPVTFFLVNVLKYLNQNQREQLSKAIQERILLTDTLKEG